MRAKFYNYKDIDFMKDEPIYTLYRLMRLKEKDREKLYSAEVKYFIGEYVEVFYLTWDSKYYKDIINMRLEAYYLCKYFGTTADAFDIKRGLYLISTDRVKETLKNHFSFGNTKLTGKIFLIFNTSPTFTCYGKTEKRCPIVKKCYARKAEFLHPSVFAYRARQNSLLDVVSRQTFCEAVMELLEKHKTIEYVRFCESGDMEPKHVDMFNYCAHYIPEMKFYTYSVFKENKSTRHNFCINGSGYMNDNEVKIVKEYSGKKAICSGLCGTKCTRCMTKTNAITEFQIH